MTNYRDIPELYEYMQLVDNAGMDGRKKVCNLQKKLIKFVRHIFETEDITVDTGQLARYMGLQKYFSFKLFPWEKFVFTLHNCTYDSDGFPRFPDLIMFVARGAGKNGYLAFEDFCLISPYNTIQEYDIDICAMSEEQAKTSFKDIYKILENPIHKSHKKILKKHFYWNKEEITGKKNNSTIKYRTNNAGSKDGMRSGKVDFDEVHAYKDYKNIKVFTTALGKKPHPRRTYISTNGDVCDGVYDDLFEKSIRILDGEIDDNGMIPFLCMIENEKEVYREENWHKANPSLQYLPNLLRETRKEYKEWLENRSSSSDFMTKRMNWRQGNSEVQITEWKNIEATNQSIDPIQGEIAVAGLDYTKINDFASAGILTKRGKKFIWIQKTWVCKNSADLPRIKFPLEEARKRGEVEIVDAPEIDADLIADWLIEKMETYNIQMLCLDDYRFGLIKKSLARAGFTYKNKNIKLVRPSDKIKIEPIIDSAFRNQNIIYGDCMIMRWYTNNTKKEMSKKYGNYEYKKIEAKSRKTDGFFAFVAAMTEHELIPEKQVSNEILPVFIM